MVKKRYLGLVGVLISAGIPALSLGRPSDPANEDFKRRCSDAAVVRCVGFDHPGAIKGRPERDPFGTMKGAAEPTLDTNVKASGASSLKFTIPSRSAADTSGNFFTNFSDDLSVQFGENEEFFVQWRQRFTKELVSTVYKGGDGFKLIIVGTGDQPSKRHYSCSALTIVATTYHQQGFPVLYNSCTGSASHGPYDGFYQPVFAGGGSRQVSDFRLQNRRAGPGCLYTHKKNGFLPPQSNCFRYVPDEWMTFQLRVKTGPRVKDEFARSHVSLWMARENEPSELVIEWGPYNLTAGPRAENQRFGKVWLLPYNTGKDPSVSYPVAYTWYDELIISRSRIPDPGVASRPQQN